MRWLAIGGSQLSKFSEAFKEPWRFTDGSYVINGEMDRAQAAREISVEIGEVVTPEQLKLGRVRFGFPPENVESREDFDGPIWYTGAGNGKGTKPVWIYG